MGFLIFCDRFVLRGSTKSAFPTPAFAALRLSGPETPTASRPFSKTLDPSDSRCPHHEVARVHPTPLFVGVLGASGRGEGGLVWSTRQRSGCCATALVAIVLLLLLPLQLEVSFNPPPAAALQPYPDRVLDERLRDHRDGGGCVQDQGVEIKLASLFGVDERVRVLLWRLGSW